MSEVVKRASKLEVGDVVLMLGAYAERSWEPITSITKSQSGRTLYLHGRLPFEREVRAASMVEVKR